MHQILRIVSIFHVWTNFDLMLKARKILLLGASGQLGQEFSCHLPSDVSLLCPTRGQLDLKTLNELPKYLDAVAPDIIINAAAYTKVDLAETEKHLSLCLNAKMPKSLANWCAVNKCRLLHFSSDYSLPGQGNLPQREDAKMAALNWYGYTKALGDQAILESGASAMVLRTSWVYSNHHKNFLVSIIKQAFIKQTLYVVCDQVGTPTPADWLTGIGINYLSSSKWSGPRLVNSVPSGFVSWHGFANAIIKELNRLNVPIKTKYVAEVDSKKMKQIALRPKNSRLNNAVLVGDMKVAVPPWAELLPELVSRTLKTL